MVIIIYQALKFLNFSFDATFVIYINKTNSPPIITINNIYENHHILVIVPHKQQTKIVWTKIIIIIETGCLKIINVTDIIILNIIVNVIQGIVLKKILVLEIRDRVTFPWSFKDFSFFDLQDRYFFKLLKLMDLLNYLIIFIYLRGIFVFLISFKHFLFILLRLEFIMLSIFLSLYSFFSLTIINIFFSIIYLTMAVCEGVLGLSVIVRVVRSSGNDNLIRLTSLW